MATVQPLSSAGIDALDGRSIKNRVLALIRLVAVVGAHGAALAAFLGSPTTAPHAPTQTIEVSLLEPAPVAEPAPPPSPQPIAKPPAPTPPPQPVAKAQSEPVEKPRLEPVAKPRPRPVVKPAPRPVPKPLRPPETTISPPKPAAEPTAQVTTQTNATTTSSKAAARASEHSAALRGTPAPVSRARFDAAYLNNPRPAYPRVSRRTNEQGRVLLRVRVEASGAPGEVQLHKSSGYHRLDKAALAAVNRWRFLPAKRGDAAIASWIIVPIDFELEGT